LQILRRAVGVLIMAERAVGIVGFQHHDLVLVIAELDGLAVDVCGRERRGFADFGGQRAQRPMPWVVNATNALFISSESLIV